MLKSLSLMLVAALLGACATMNNLSSDVSTYGSWPAGQTSPRFVFDRIPSQSAEQQQTLEAAALPALTAAGFRQVDDPAAADYIVQLGATVTADPRWIDDHGFYSPFGWHAGWRHRHFGIGFGGGWGWGRYGGPLASQTYSREVVVQIRDRRSGRTVYETRAANSGYSPSIRSLLPAMFDAAMAGFPNSGGANPRRIVTPITG
ncbi:DUF4136 domain-containing protein [Piscinibacter sakaiensis]|uniref:DUF4136 domain-containing protein n=1 Tax=Piscinibacter sakaiensis TaxID=1547922 RepID=UPI003AAF647E